MRTDILERKDEILQWVEEGQSKAFICKQLQCKPETLNNYLKQMNIEYKGQQNKKGQQKGTNKYKPASYYFDNKTFIHSQALKEKLFKDGLKKKECEICGVSIWQGVELSLELHHKDNNHFNNNFENLQILCPNCHSIQEGNAGANIGKYANQQNINLDSFEEPELILTPKKEQLCIDCGKPISFGAVRCQNCYHKSTRIDKYTEETHVMRDTGTVVNREELKKLIRTTPFLQIGQKFGVSDNAVRKWCDRFGLPRKVSEIKQISDEDWEKI